MGGKSPLGRRAGPAILLVACLGVAAWSRGLADEPALGATAQAGLQLQATLGSPPPPASAPVADFPSEPRHGEETASEAPPAPGGQARIPFNPRGKSSPAPGEDDGDPSGALGSVITVASSLAVVLGLFLVLAWAMRRTAPGASATLPGEVLEVLGRSVLAGREQLHLVRCGRKLLLVSVGQSSVTTLTEITDPDEVDRLAGLCRQSQPGSTTVAFRQVFEQLAGSRTAPPAGAPKTAGRPWEGRDV